MSHFVTLKRMYESAPINEFFRPTIHIEGGSAAVRMAVRPDMHHAAHAAHGAVYFKALDDAAFFAVQSLLTDVFALTSTFQVHLLSPVTDGEMVATGKVVHESKRLFVAGIRHRSGWQDRGARQRHIHAERDPARPKGRVRRLIGPQRDDGIHG